MSKILYVASNMQHINNFHLPYIERLREDGNTVLVMASGEGADFDVRFKKSIFSVKNLLSQIKIRKIVKAEGFDSIILNTTLAAFHVRMALPKKKRPRVMNIVHGYLFHEGEGGLKKRLYLFCEKLLRKKTDMLVLMNAEDERIAKENSLTDGEIINVCGMGASVAEEKISPASIRKFTGTEDAYLIGFVGELSARKNQRFLICALPEIRIYAPNAALMLVGKGAEEDSLRALADRLGVSEAVHFVGHKDNPCDFIRSFDLYASASEIEGMPFNIIEAIGCGAPILASMIKGHEDLITDGEEGYLYERGNMGDFVSKVKAFYLGDISVNAESQKLAFDKYSFGRAFEQTYSVLKAFVK